tara:strand:- start:208 stop:393 length:186 start_codon:yes stop_codon:yes gene_type:complete
MAGDLYLIIAPKTGVTIPVRIRTGKMKSIIQKCNFDELGFLNSLIVKKTIVIAIMRFSKKT